MKHPAKKKTGEVGGGGIWKRFFETKKKMVMATLCIRGRKRSRSACTFPSSPLPLSLGLWE